MAARRLTPYVVVGLVLIGTLCVALRFQARRDVRLGYGDTVWRLTYSIECEVERPGARLRTAIPSDTRSAHIFRQDVRHSNLRISPLRPAGGQTREVVAVAQEEDECELTLRFDLHLRPAATTRARRKKSCPRIPSGLRMQRARAMQG